MKDPQGFGDGSLRSFTDCIWTATTPIRFAGTWMPHVMTVISLDGEGVLLHSPCRPSDDLMEAIANLGPVSDVIAPNWFHDLYLTEYRRLYPRATFWGPAFLQRQRQAIIDRPLDGSVQATWFAKMPHTTLSGLLTFDESIFFHLATRTLIVADLLMNASLPAGAPVLTRLGYRFFGLRGQLKVFPILRWLGVGDRSSLRKAAAQVFEWNPLRLIVAHGTPIREGATSQLQAAFDWLAAG